MMLFVRGMVENEETDGNILILYYLLDGVMTPEHPLRTVLLMSLVVSDVSIF